MKIAIRRLLNYHIPPRRTPQEPQESQEFGWDAVVTYYPIGLPTPPAMIRFSEPLVIEEILR